MRMDTTGGETVEALIDALDADAAEAGEGHRAAPDPARRASRRQDPRYPFRATCLVRSPSACATGLPRLSGHTRNLSRYGLGLLVRGSFSTGDVVEVQIAPTGHEPVFMAGVVRFCRYAGRGYREIGVQLLATRSEPILSGQEGVPPELLAKLREG